MAGLDQSVIATLYSQLVSHAESLGVFDGGVNPSEPWSAPGSGLWCAFAPPSVTPLPRASGLAQVTARVEFKAVAGASISIRPPGRVDQMVMNGGCALMNAYAGAFTLGANVRNIDLLGGSGAPMTGTPGVWTIGEHHFRVYEVTLPLIVNDVFGEVA